MLPSRFRLVFAASAVTAAARLVQVPFNNQPGAHLSPDIDGPWPTLRFGYEGSQENLTLNAYLTLSNASLLVRPQICADEVADGILRCGEFAFPEFYLNASTTNQVMLHALTDFETWKTPDLTPWGDISLTGSSGLDFCRFMSLDGNIAGINYISDLAGHRIQTPAVVGEKLTTLASNDTRSVPLLNSMMSLPKIAASLSETGRVSSAFSSFHMRSVEPPVNGSLIVGGYDNNKIMGDLLNWTETYNSYGNPDHGLALSNIYVGVDSGFLPLENLRLNNRSFPQGPYKQEPSILHESRNSTVDAVIIEPGTPYLHLSRRVCDSLAELLDLEYDVTRNLYLWSYPPDHPIFRSPVYLELVLVLSSEQYYEANDKDETMYPSLSIKIPMASLQHTFHATTRATNGSLLPPARYFPCSQHESEWETGFLTWPRLGRAFLQSAFIASCFKYNDTEDTVANYWLAQAPGPAGMEGNTTEDLTEVSSGTMPNRTGVILEANAWTKSWSSVLPVWTLDHDGATTLDQLNETPEGPQQTNLGVKVAVPIVGTAATLLALFFGVKGIHRSRVNNTRIKRDISEEDATAREIERLIILELNTELMPLVSTDDGSTNSHSSSVSSLSEDDSRIFESEHVLAVRGGRTGGTAVPSQ
ncbi:hypothetical protein E0Z10_g3766 [Xylaria hypoxylon]|uniref:Peptidase A1 domain-containing protein n=1 Tax=Xylaria hypoxylon TaxID=37992 RepID=A0A4Z0Z0U7_9PEZI|nr:hypothetical protein E0Z10_g3766 [Xylaria hypoxylon]